LIGMEAFRYERIDPLGTYLVDELGVGHQDNVIVMNMNLVLSMFELRMELVAWLYAFCLMICYWMSMLDNGILAFCCA
jgi:hypothetical protein